MDEDISMTVTTAFATAAEAEQNPNKIQTNLN
jgi:hypothetical protein